MRQPQWFVSALVCLAAMSGDALGVRAQQPPPRDAASVQSALRTGTAAIAGVVVSDGTPAEPVRRVTVTLSETGNATGPRAAVTDDDGRFAFLNLPAGRYLVTATKAAYLPTAYGLARVAKPGSLVTGTAIALAEGQRLDPITLRITRGGVLTGTVRDADGQPVRTASVVLMYLQRAPLTGVRTPTADRNASVFTDSRGVYRIFGLAPGEYLILATMPFGLRDLEATTAADVQRVGDLVRAGSTRGPLAAPASAPVRRRPTYGYAPVLYPGTSSVPEATTITIGPGEERAGLDFQMRLVPNALLTGTTVGPDGRPIADVRVTASLTLGATGVLLIGQFATSDAEGRFRAAGLAPGPYTVEALSPTSSPSLKGREQVSIVDGADVDLRVSMTAGFTLAGRLIFEPRVEPPPMDFSRLRINLSRDDGGAGAPVGTPGADGRFTVTGVLPGRYRVRVTVPPASPTSGRVSQDWVVKSATIGERDALDAGVEIQGDLTNALVTLTTRVSEVTGAITDGAGRPAPEYFIIAFPVDRALWTWGSRRIQQTRPSHDGKFAFRNLPAGEYLIGAVTDVEQNEWFEPAFLDQLFGSSVKLTLADGEKKIQDIRLR